MQISSLLTDQMQALMRKIGKTKTSMSVSDSSFASQSPSALDTKQRILILDDDPLTLWITTHFLTKQGFEDVEVTTSPSECLRKVEVGKWDVLVLDYRIPEMTGAEVARQLTEAAGAKIGSLPKMIALTFNPTSEVTKDCHDAGIAAVLSKPLRAAEFSLALEAAH